jgi:hypothetical protein
MVLLCGRTAVGGISDFPHSRYRVVVLSSWDRAMSGASRTHPLPQGGTDLMGLRHE